MPATPRATDNEIKEIIERNEAGVADLLEAYDLAEKKYASVLQMTDDSASPHYGVTTNTSANLGRTT